MLRLAGGRAGSPEAFHQHQAAAGVIGPDGEQRHAIRRRGQAPAGCDIDHGGGLYFPWVDNLERDQAGLRSSAGRLVN